MQKADILQGRATCKALRTAVSLRVPQPSWNAGAAPQTTHLKLWGHLKEVTMDKLNFVGNAIDLSIVPGQSQPLHIQLHSNHPAPEVHSFSRHPEMACAWQHSRVLSWDTAAMRPQQALYRSPAQQQGQCTSRQGTWLQETADSRQ